MKSKLVLYLTFIILFLFVTLAISKEQYNVNVERVIDGDTFQIIWNPMPFNLNKISIRISEIDTPEIKSKCVGEHEKALTAKQYLQSTIENKTVSISDCQYDKFGGRWDCVVEYNNQNIAHNMINNGLAKPYFGDKKGSWCINEKN